MKKLLALTATLALTLLMPACKGKPVATPRPEAWPRLAPDTAVTLVDSLDPSGNRFITKRFNRWKADIYITLSAIDRASYVKAVNNRLQRVRLNAGDLPLSVEQWGGLSVFRTRASQPTPLQFLQTDTASWLLSGAVYLTDPKAVANADSTEATVDSLAARLPEILSEYADI